MTRVRFASALVLALAAVPTPAWAAGLLLGDDRYSYQTLRDRLDQIPADVRIAVLDACSSGAFTRLKGGRARRPFLVDESADMRGHAFLTSSAATEAAQESDRIRASYFTHYLVSGFRGAADLSGDGKVTLNEAYRFAFDETLGRTVHTRGGAQTLGGHVGAGFDVHLARSFNVGLEVGYNAMMNFREPVGLHDNFNGMQVALGVGWLFGKGYAP